jgi:hypothetical protein
MVLVRSKIRKQGDAEWLAVDREGAGSDASAAYDLLRARIILASEQKDAPVAKRVIEVIPPKLLVWVFENWQVSAPEIA